MQADGYEAVRNQSQFRIGRQPLPNESVRREFIDLAFGILNRFHQRQGADQDAAAREDGSRPMGTRGQAHPNFQQRRSAFDVAENAVWRIQEITSFVTMMMPVDCYVDRLDG